MSEVAKKLLEDKTALPEWRSAAWDELCTRINAELKRQICGRPKQGRSVFKGFPCEQNAELNGCCRLHGARTKSGPQHWNYKHGRYSKALKGQSLQKRYEAALADPNLLNLTNEIALRVARQQELLEQLPEHVDYLSCSNKLDRLRDAIKQNADGEVESLLDDLDKTFAAGLSQEKVWGEIDRNGKELRRFVDVERKYREGMKLNIGAEKMDAILGIVLDSIMRNVPQQYADLVYDDLRTARAAVGPATGGGNNVRYRDA